MNERNEDKVQEKKKKKKKRRRRRKKNQSQIRNQKMHILHPNTNRVMQAVCGCKGASSFFNYRVCTSGTTTAVFRRLTQTALRKGNHQVVLVSPINSVKRLCKAHACACVCVCCVCICALCIYNINLYIPGRLIPLFLRFLSDQHFTSDENISYIYIDNTHVCISHFSYSNAFFASWNAFSCLA